MSLDQKKALAAELRRRLQDELETLVAAQMASQAGATHEEAKPENDKDTRALEQSYLARGQAVRVQTLEDDIGLLKRMRLRAFTNDSPIALGALVEVVDASETLHCYFLMPAGAGEELGCPSLTVKIVTPGSPLGRALSGALEEDDVNIQSPTGQRSLTIRSVK